MRAAKAIAMVLVALGALLAATPAHAVEPYYMEVGVLGGVGGPLDVTGADPGLGNRTLQLQLGLLTEPATLVQLRLGRFDFGNEQLGNLDSARLDYATIAGEYRFSYGWYDSGMFLGLGGYRLEGDRVDGSGSTSNTAFGVTFGVTGEFELSHRFFLVGEVAAHYAELHDAKLFGDAKFGIALHF
jgi:hypothetical protein